MCLPFFEKNNFSLKEIFSQCVGLDAYEIENVRYVSGKTRKLYAEVVFTNLFTAYKLQKYSALGLLPE